MNAIDEVPFDIEKLDGPDAVATVPEAVVTLLPVRSLIVHQEHVRLLTGDVGHHPAGKGALFHVPDNLGVGLLAVELRMDSRPGLREIELVWLSLVPKGRQKLPRKSQTAYLGPPSADIEDAVCQLLPRELTGKIVG